MTLSEALAVRHGRRLLLRAERNRLNSAAATINWKFETHSLIAEEVLRFAQPGYGRWIVMPSGSSNDRLQVDLHSDRFYPTALGSPDLERESPASLVFSLHPNGSIAVIAYGHGSAHVRAAPRYVDFIPHPWSLAATYGRAKVRRYLRDFGRLAIATRTDSSPTRSNSRFLRRLESQSDRFATAFSSPAEARRHRLSNEATFSMGLVAGLVASTILPLAKDFGDETRSAAAATLKRCLESKLPSTALSRCLSGGDYETNHLASVLLSPGWLVIFALVLSMVALVFVLRIQRAA